jgi:guanylate cyclase
MADQSRLKKSVEYFLSFGAFPGESVTERGRRRIFVGYAWVGSVVTIGPVLVDLRAGMPWVAALESLIIVFGIPGLFVIKAKPHLFRAITRVALILVFSIQLAVTALLGGLWASGLAVVLGLIIVLAAAVALSLRAALWWSIGFVGSVVYAALIPRWIEARYVIEDPTADAVLNITVTGLFTVAVVLYFARQRDRFQQQSDNLLRNILPDEIADRLKVDSTMIADHFDDVSVLFADVVDFTPMSAHMTPTELVGVLNALFSVFDGFVDEVGLEKIKTVGDEYMVAAGVPTPRTDHAHAAADLALRMRDYVAANRIADHHLEMRIGVHSGPVVAGIIGTGKFSYDLWGDTVNTASRMESSGIAGSIQVSAATYRLIRQRYDCTPRGMVAVKGKGDMETFILTGTAIR